MGLGECWRAIKMLWWVVVIGLLLGIGAGFYLAYFSAPKYQSTVTFFADTPSTGAASALQGDQFGQLRINSYVKLLSSERLADLVVARVRGVTTPFVMSAITGVADLNTVQFTATVTDGSARQSLAIAKVVAAEFPALVNDVESFHGQKTAPVQLDVVSGPSLNPIPVSPKKKVDVGVGALVGLSVGIALALLREILDTTVRSVETLRTLVDLPVLGVITADPSYRKSPLIIESNSGSLRAESFRQLRTNLQFVDVDEPASIIVVTSAVVGEGKSVIAANLAIAFAQAGKSVLLIDADLRRPKLAEYLGVEGSVGLTNVLAHQMDVNDVIQPSGRGGLAVLVSGSIPPNPSELLGSQGMHDLVDLLRSTYEIIVIDTPALLPVTDAAVAASHADGTVLIVRRGRTTRTSVANAVETLRAIDVRVLGAVLTFSPAKGAHAERKHARYDYHREEPAGSARSTMPRADRRSGPLPRRRTKA